MKNALRWTMVFLMAIVATLTFSPETSFARGGGGRGGGRGGGGRGGGRGGGGRGGRGGSRGGGRGGRSGGNTGPKSQKPMDYLIYLQEQEADDGRLDFIFNTRDENLVVDRDRSRNAALKKQRDDAANRRRESERQGSHPL